MTELRYLIVVEGDETVGFSSYAPDLPGVVATGASRDECLREMRDAVAFHVDGLRDAGEEIPTPSPVSTAYVNVAA
jgi:predicted RNase H-like HicB family nuclease